MKKLIYLVVLLLTVSTLTLSGCKGSVEKPSATQAPASEADFE